MTDAEVSQIYRCLASSYPDHQWAALALRDALLCGVLVERMDRSKALALVGALKFTQALPALPLEETLSAARIDLIATYLANIPDPTHEQTEAALVLDRIAAILKESSRSSERPTPHVENVKAMIAAAQPQTTQNEPRELSPTIKVRKLTAQLSTRLGNAVHDSHQPAIRWYPLPHEVRAIRLFLNNSKTPTSVDLVLGHLLFGRFASALFQLDTDAERLFSVRSTPTGLILEIRVPQIHGPSHASNTPGYENVDQILHLPLPKNLTPQIERVRKAIDKTGGKNPAKLLLAKANQHLRDFGRNRGVSLSLKRASRLLPAYLEESKIDQTILHLLRLASFSSRDSGIYYFSPDKKLLIERFKVAVTRIVTEIGDEALLESGWREVAPFVWTESEGR